MRPRVMAVAGLLIALGVWWLWPCAQWRGLPASAKEALASLPPVTHVTLPAPPAAWQAVRYGPVSFALPAEEVRSASCALDAHPSCSFLLEGYQLSVLLEWPARGGTRLLPDAEGVEPFTVKPPSLLASRRANRRAVRLGRMIRDAQLAGMLTELRAATFTTAGARGLYVRNPSGGLANLYPERSPFRVTVLLIRRRVLPERFLPILGSLRLEPDRLDPRQLAADAAAIEARWPYQEGGSNAR
jgi:hypothetical protein